MISKILKKKNSEFRLLQFGWLALLLLLAKPGISRATNGADTTPSYTLEQCIDFAKQHQPAINEAQLNIAITKLTNKISLAGWLPQATASGSLLHYNTLPVSFSAGSLPVHAGVYNTAAPILSVSENLFNPQLFYAAKTAKPYLDQAKQVADSTRIFLVSMVSKSYYNLLQTLQQIDVLREDTARLERNVKDTYHQFIGGIVDESDYDEAIISLNNSKAQLVQQIENVIPQYAVLKQIMGCPPAQQFNVVFDTARMDSEIGIDTAQILQYDKRIEYAQLQTNMKIQHELTKYYDLAFLPNLSVFYDYYDAYGNNEFSSLFNTAYPYSYYGLSLNIPLFTGFSRVENVRKSKLQEQTLSWSKQSLESEIYAEYTAALGNYKSNVYNWQMMKENKIKAKNVYRIVSLQYKQGVVAYLNMIVAESNLVSAEIGEINALFQVLSSKIDLEKALGNIH